MKNVVYEEELVREEIYNGTLILEGRMSEEEQKEKIYEMMEKDGVTVPKKEEIEIGYVGADDNEGLSETQTSDFVVTHVYKKQVPYLIKKEEVFSCEMVDGSAITPEEQETRVLQMMKDKGVEVPDNYEISYVQSEEKNTSVVVYKVTKEKVDSKEMEDALALRDELVSLKEQISAATNSDEVVSLYVKVSSIDEKIEALNSSNSRDYSELEKIVESLDLEISELEELLQSKIEKLESSYEKVKELMGSEDEDLLSVKKEENERISSIRKTMDGLISKINESKKNRKKAVHDLETAKALGLSSAEYLEIIKNTKNKKLMDAILVAKGLNDIIAIPASERTKEQREILKAARNDIKNEIFDAKAKNEEVSVLKLIEALYGIETEIKLRGKQRVLIVKKKALDNIVKNSKQLPEKIRGEVKVDYVPGDAPKDMSDVLPSTELSVVGENITALVPTEEKHEEIVANDSTAEKTTTPVPVEEKHEEVAVNDNKVENTTAPVPTDEDVLSREAGLEEVFTFFIDIKNQNSVYVRKYVFERFNLKPVSEEHVRVNGEECYQISLDDAKFVAENANNNYSPYNVKFDSIEFDREKGLIEQFTFFIDLDDKEKAYARKYVFERFGIDKADSKPVRINGEICYAVNLDDIREISRLADNDYSPYQVNFDSVDFNVNKRNTMVSDKPAKEYLDKFVIYLDNDTDKIYVNKSVFERFNIDLFGRPATIDNVVCFEIDKDDANYILNNANNTYSPYAVEIKKVKAEVISNDHELYNSVENRGLVDKYTIFRDIDSGKLYVRKPVFDRFHANAIGEEVRIKGVSGYEISEKDAEYILSNSDNNYSPYVVDFVNLRVTKTNKEEKEEVVEEVSDDNSKEEVKETDSSRGLTDKYTIFKDTLSDKLFAMKPVFDRFNLEKNSEVVRINGVACHELSPSDALFIKGNANNSYSPYIVEEKGLPLGVSLKAKVVDEDKKNDKFTLYKDINSERLFANKPVIDRFNLNKNLEKVNINGDSYHEIDKEDASFIENNANNNYSPYTVENKEIPLGLNKTSNDNLASRGVSEKITLFKDIHSDRIFAMKPVFKRFNIDEVGEPVRINGIACHEINPEDALFIVRNSDNNYSPYQVVYRELPLGLKKVTKDNVDSHEVINNTVRDTYTLYRDLDNNKFYTGDKIFNRFRFDKLSEAISLDGEDAFEISADDVNYVVSNKNNKYSPYDVIIKDVVLGKKVVPEEVVQSFEMPQALYGPAPVLDTQEVKVDEVMPSDEEVINLFRDLNDNDQVYASNDVLHRFGISPTNKGIMINGVEAHKIGRDTDQIINSIAKMSHNPKMVIRYTDVYLEKQRDASNPKPHVEEIIDKLTSGLDIRPKDQKRYRASNIKVSKGFRDELKSGNLAYNIVHIIPATLRAGTNFFRKLSAKIVTSKRARNAMQTIQERLDQLSEEELEVLFDEYKGSQLKTDMNNQINPLILDTVRTYGLRKVAKLNDEIRVNYGELFTILGEIKVLEEEIAKDDTSKDRAVILNDERKRLLEAASSNVRRILDCRREANNLLSSGVHGIEEDFKAVSTKLSYVGLRFGKTKKFDNELQHKLGDFGRNLNTALASNNAEGIVQSFMGLESCYYDNTEIRGSLVGKRSVGSKYYTPVAEQFDYRDDPFMRDLLSTVAISSAAVAAINAYRIHQVESQEISDTLTQVQKTGQEIAGKKETIREGLEAQAHQDVLNAANVQERAALDSTGWKFGSAYRAADNAGHTAYNQFGEEVSQNINQVCSDYSQGLITDAEALQRMANISNDAQATLNDVVNSSLDILRDYAATHPQFDLRAVQESMEYISAHPDAIADMNQAMVDITNLADSLATQNVAHLASLSALPSDMASTLVCAASSAALATYVSNKMNGYNKTKSTYTEEIAGMMDDYVNDEDLVAARSR